MVKKIIVGLLIVALLCAGGWYYFTRIDHMPIDKILKNPRAYDGKNLTIEGQVTDRTSILFIKFFKLNDKTGEITVVTKRTLPAIGSTARVTGKIEEAFSLGDQQMLVFVEGADEGGKDKK